MKFYDVGLAICLVILVVVFVVFVVPNFGDLMAVAEILVLASFTDFRLFFSQTLE